MKRHPHVEKPKIIVYPEGNAIRQRLPYILHADEILYDVDGTIPTTPHRAAMAWTSAFNSTVGAGGDAGEINNAN